MSDARHEVTFEWNMTAQPHTKYRGRGRHGENRATNLFLLIGVHCPGAPTYSTRTIPFSLDKPIMHAEPLEQVYVTDGATVVAKYGTVHADDPPLFCVLDMLDEQSVPEYYRGTDDLHIFTDEAQCLWDESWDDTIDYHDWLEGNVEIDE